MLFCDIVVEQSEAQDYLMSKYVLCISLVLKENEALAHTKHINFVNVS